MLGERLFLAIERFQPAHAGKIAGMFLVMDDVCVILDCLDSEQQVKILVAEMLSVLETAKKA